MNNPKDMYQNLDTNSTVLEKREQLQTRLKTKLEESTWLHKFKQLSDLLTTIKTEIPATIFCDLRWLTEEETLLIHCPNPETKASLENEADKFAQVCSFAQRFVITYLDTPDFVITCSQTSNVH
ncbi:hypothetical protein Pse7367_3945 (plasmid) [Thalassoporum mexicanum PCC 7367]|uniref:hypothetical protein n=1 Tax=Thalassoporum mexicanum TaxID=3457544 RepID=UPI00029FEDBA|nr:hypothetical protein [Pseudanabaena sp. PCC 7367]AFY72160.1 hypothetical protein Pse7367_3945 [Pseudanabaena sp. PCC 7367]